MIDMTNSNKILSFEEKSIKFIRKRNKVLSASSVYFSKNKQKKSNIIFFEKPKTHNKLMEFDSLEEYLEDIRKRIVKKQD